MVKPDVCTWAGVFPAATTQFEPDLKVDLRGTARVQQTLVSEGVHGLVVLGTVALTIAVALVFGRSVPRDQPSAHAAPVHHLPGRLSFASGTK